MSEVSLVFIKMPRASFVNISLLPPHYVLRLSSTIQLLIVDST